MTDFSQRSGTQFRSTNPAPTFPQMRLHVRSDLHLARKLWHMSMGLIIVWVYQTTGMDSGTAVSILAPILGFAILMEAFRLRNPQINERCMRFWGPVMRSCEVDRVTGIPFYLLATVIAVGVFPRPVAVLSILYLAFGDPMASLVGILYGHRSIRLPGGKSLIGTAAGIVTCAVVTFFYLRTTSIPHELLAPLVIVGGVAGGTAELAPIEADDNLTIPVISGFALWLAFILLGLAS